MDPHCRPCRQDLDISQQRAHFLPSIAADATDLSTMFSYLNANNIALAMQAGMGTRINTYSTTSAYTEGYGPLNGITRQVQNIKNAGGNLQYLQMDEPLSFNYVTGGPDYSIAQLANLLAINVKDVEAIFPNVQIVDIEALGGPGGLSVAQIMEFATDYHDATGQKS